jgi:hypothetical protein
MMILCLLRFLFCFVLSCLVLSRKATCERNVQSDDDERSESSIANSKDLRGLSFVFRLARSGYLF